MAADRARRSNAGSKMASLLNEEEAALMKSDSFYSTQYGGFGEEGAVDKDFTYHSPNEDEDQVDSDFSIDENDEPKSDLEDEEGKAKRPKRALGVQTKAYKEPKKGQQIKERKKRKKETREAKEKRIKEQIKRKLKDQIQWTDFGRKEARASTVTKTAETAQRQKEREAKARKLLRKKLNTKKPEVEPELTQEDKLEEAKLTEKLNLATLKKYEQMEIEARKKAVKLTTKTMTGPYVRFLSTSMPKGREPGKRSRKDSENIVVDEEEVKEDEEEEEEKEVNANSSKDRQARTFLTFSDFDTFRESFPKQRHSNPRNKTCPITRLPAKYFDPVTRLPYANLSAFRIIREAYYSQLESKGDRSDPEVAAWLEWRAKNKPTSAKPVIAQVTRPPPSFTQMLNPSATPAPVAAVAAPSPAAAPVATKSVPPPQAPAPLFPNTSAKPAAVAAAMAAANAAASGSLTPMEVVAPNATPTSPYQRRFIPSVSGSPLASPAKALLPTTPTPPHLINVAAASSPLAVRSVASSPVTALPTQPAPIHPSQLQSQQSVVLPVRTTPLPQSPIVHVSTVNMSVPQLAALPTQPAVTAALAAGTTVSSAGGGTVQTVRIGGPAAQVKKKRTRRGKGVSKSIKDCSSPVGFRKHVRKMK